MVQASTSETTPPGNTAKAVPLPARRQALLQFSLALIAQRAYPAGAAERRGIGRYIKKKALDPLVTCVPGFMLAICFVWQVHMNVLTTCACSAGMCQL